MASIAILTSFASIFFPTYSGVRPTISPATKIEMMTKSSIPYMPEPTPPTMISPSCDIDERDHAPERREGIVHGVHCAARGRRGDDGEQGRRRDAEADLLALRVAAGKAERVERVVAVRFRRSSKR